MGLDSYFVVGEDDPHKVECEATIGYWRKNWPVHYWMAEEYYKQTKDASDFNCEYLEVSKDLLNRLLKDIEDGEVVYDDCFYDSEKEWKEATISVIKYVQDRMKDLPKNLHVYFCSWY